MRVEEVRGLVMAHMPGGQVESVVRLGWGLDNVAYEVDGELIVRFSTDPDQARRAQRVRREARLLAAVARISPLPVPKPKFTVPERGCLAYVELPGVPLLDVPRTQLPGSRHGYRGDARQAPRRPARGAGVLPQRPGDRARPRRPGRVGGDRRHRLERCRRRRSSL